MIDRSLVTQSVTGSFLQAKNPKLNYENITLTTSANVNVRNNGTTCVSFFKASGSFAWDTQAYISTGFTAPVTMEFNKWAGNQDNSMSYAMISWNNDPTTDPNYTSLNYASYPYYTGAYQIYNNGTYINPGTTWNRNNKFYLVYGTDGFIRHYNGSSQIYSVNYGTGQTVYMDSSLYSPSATFGGFTNLRIIKLAWNGTSY